MSRRTTVFLVIALLGGLLGLFYSGSSTVDFTNHLDRQLHPVSCSLLAGLQETSLLDEAAAGCKAALFSPYSSFWRDRHWGGVPWSLLAMGLFGFALALSLWGLLTRRGHEIPVSVGLLVAGTVALVSSAVFFSIALGKLHAVCKTCVGTYIASVLLDLGAVLVFLSAAKDRKDALARDPSARPAGRSAWVGSLIVLAELGLAVGIPFLVYRATLPDYGKYVTQCGALKTTEDKRGALLPLTPATHAGRVPAVLVVDPLCPACSAFHERLVESPWYDRLAVRVALLPLDKDCNWMMSDSMHPGSCVIAQGMICAKDRALEVLEWAFQHQKEFRPLDQADRPATRIREALLAKWPQWKECLDAPETRIALTNVLHWAVDQSLPVLTPQLYVQGRRLCDEDTDLGLDYAMNRLLETRCPRGLRRRRTMKIAWAIHGVLMASLLLALGLWTRSMVASAGRRLETGESLDASKKKAPVIAQKAEEPFCTPELKETLRRVLTNCGLIGGGRRGCQPNELRNVAQISDQDFNTLFKPLKHRAGIILFDPEKDDLDEGAKRMLDRLWADQRGASWFFVVARASTDDTVERNRVYSHRRANSVLFYLQDRFKDPDLDQKMGLLWLGEEYAQLDASFCEWDLSRPVEECRIPERNKAQETQLVKRLNRSAIVSWIDCRL